MIKKSLTIILISLIAVASYAQESRQKASDFSDQKAGKSYIQILGGVNSSWNDNYRRSDIGKSLGFAGELSLGKEFNPYWGGFFSLGYNKGMSMYKMGREEYEKYTFDNYEFFINGTYNLSNGLGTIRADRKTFWYLNAGLGIVYADTKDEGYDFHRNNGTVAGLRAGLMGVHWFSNRVAAVAELNGYLFGDSNEGQTSGVGMDLRVNAQIGLRIGLGPNPSRWQPLVQYVDKVQYKVDTVRVVEKVVETVNVPVTEPMKYETVFFQINSSKIQETETSKIKEIADILNNNSGKVVFIIGSADKETGSKTINDRLSKARAKVVADKLMNDYGVSDTRIITSLTENDKYKLYRRDYVKNRAAICIIADFNE